MLMFPLCVTAQKDVTTVGIQYKPIFPFDFLGTGPVENSGNGVDFEIALNSGFSGGLIVRHGFSNLLALETGINYVKRKFSLSITDGDFTGESDFRIIGYEIPVTLMVYAQVGEKMYLNGSMGPCLSFYASNVQSSDEYFRHVSFRNKVMQPAISANIGTEYRTERSGFFYFGFSYNRPFDFIYESAVRYNYRGKEVNINNTLLGNYLTIDLRYFFHEDPKRKKGSR